MTREEHLQWCKDRAMQYVNDGDLVNAVGSMMSDINKHEETADKGLGMLGIMAAMEATKGNRREVIRYIEGFN